ncbi:MAG: recombinase family protein [Gammaproteobacteria bacterium]|nr:recombinase family protein [Gammaproteobacteria bacterium]
MLVGYIRVSKTDGSQNFDLQIDTLTNKGVHPDHIYQDEASGKNIKRPGLEACIKALRENDTLVVWKLDRLGRSLHDLVNLVKGLSDKNIGLKVLTGKGANIDTTTPTGKMFFGFFAVLAEFERDLIIERTKAGLESARARGRKGGRKHSLTKSQIRLAQAAMGKKETVVSHLCQELGITRPTLYRYIAPDGTLRDQSKSLLNMQEKIEDK